jgi:hypothetical protein
VDANYYVVGGEEGSLQVPGSVSGRVVDNALHLHLINGDVRKEEVFPAENPYHVVAEHFGACIEKRAAPLVTTEETLANIAFLDEIRQHASHQRFPGFRLRA